MDPLLEDIAQGQDNIWNLCVERHCRPCSCRMRVLVGIALSQSLKRWFERSGCNDRVVFDIIVLICVITIPGASSVDNADGMVFAPGYAGDAEQRRSCAIQGHDEQFLVFFFFFLFGIRIRMLQDRSRLDRSCWNIH